jgi:hypothetical protein
MQQWGATAISLVACSGNQEHPNCRTRSHALLDLGWRRLSRIAPCARRCVFRYPAPRCRRAISPSVSAVSGVLSDRAPIKTRAATLNGQSGRVRAGAANVKCRGFCRDRTNPRRLSGSAAGDSPAASRASSDEAQRHHCRGRGAAPLLLFAEEAAPAKVACAPLVSTSKPPPAGAPDTCANVPKLVGRPPQGLSTCPGRVVARTHPVARRTSLA